MTIAAELVDVSREFRRGVETIQALEAVSVSFASGELAAVRGVSGSGKSTLLKVLAALIRPDSGTVSINGRPIGDISLSEQAALRRESVFMIFQEFNLVPTLTVVENASLSLLLRGKDYGAAVAVGAAALTEVGLDGTASRMPSELSGGQRQRVAVARALAGHRSAEKPALLLADEPTGSLDSRTASDLFALLREVAHSGLAVVVATHDQLVEQVADQSFAIVDGHLRAMSTKNSQ